MDYIKRIKDLREDSDKTQQEIADVLKTSQTMYARYERGANELPVHHLITLADYYGVSTDYILCRTNNTEINLQILIPTFNFLHNKKEANTVRPYGITGVIHYRKRHRLKIIQSVFCLFIFFFILIALFILIFEIGFFAFKNNL